MILSFTCRETERIWNGQYSKKFPSDIQRRVRRKLIMMAAAVTLDDIRVPPSNRLEKLKGSLDGFYSIRVNVQWRIIFNWTKSGVTNVKLTDYH